MACAIRSIHETVGSETYAAVRASKPRSGFSRISFLTCLYTPSGEPTAQPQIPHLPMVASALELRCRQAVQS